MTMGGVKDGGTDRQERNRKKKEHKARINEEMQGMNTEGGKGEGYRQ